MTLKRIIDDASNIQERASIATSNQKKELVGGSIIIEESLIEWVWDMWEREIFISGGLIKEQARRLLHDANRQLTLPNRLTLISVMDGSIDSNKATTLRCIEVIKKTATPTSKRYNYSCLACARVSQTTV